MEEHNWEPEISPELRAYLEQTHPKWKKFARAIIPLPQRTILAVMTFFGVVFAYSMRICLSITIIAIIVNRDSSNLTDYCPVPSNFKLGLDKPTVEPREWDEKKVGYILSAFYIGYVITHIPGGIMSDLLGGKHVLTGCVVVTSLFTLITPLCIIDGGVLQLIIIRLLMGVVQGTMFPAVNVLLAAWIPADERSFYGGLVYGSSQIGTALGTILPGELLGHYISWDVVYYIMGGSGVIWGLLFHIMCSSDPQNHSYISDEEKEMLQTKIGEIHRTSRIKDAPWSEILVNIPLLVLVIAQCGHDFAFFFMITYLPKYLYDVIHYNIMSDGLFSAVPFLGMYVVSLISGSIADCLIDRDIMSVANCRKLFTTIASILPAIGLILASYGECDRKFVTLSLTAGLTSMGFYYSGARVNGLDLSPRFAGTVMAYVNGVGALMGVIAPILAGNIISNSTFVEYRALFWISFILLNSSAVLYVFYASGDVQPFNHHSHHLKPLPVVPHL